MADIDLPSTGKDTQLSITVNGVVIRVADKITGFTADEEKDEIQTKLLGQSGSQRDQEFTGWKGTFNLAENTAEIDEMMDTIRAAQIARVPIDITINDTTYYRDGTSKTYAYPDCKLSISKSKKRGEANSSTLNWMTGKDRIAA